MKCSFSLVKRSLSALSAGVLLLFFMFPGFQQYVTHSWTAFYTPYYCLRNICVTFKPNWGSALCLPTSTVLGYLPEKMYSSLSKVCLCLKGSPHRYTAQWCRCLLIHYLITHFPDCCGLGPCIVFLQMVQPDPHASHLLALCSIGVWEKSIFVL